LKSKADPSRILRCVINSSPNRVQVPNPLPPLPRLSHHVTPPIQNQATHILRLILLLFLFFLLGLLLSLWLLLLLFLLGFLRWGRGGSLGVGAGGEVVQEQVRVIDMIQSE
jgi:hypothetical protein